MADIVEVTARLGDSIVSIAHGSSVTIGEAGDVFAPMPTTTVSTDTIGTIRAGVLVVEVRRVVAPTERVPRKRFDQRPAAYIALSMLAHLAMWGVSTRFYGESGIGAGTITRWVPSIATPPRAEYPPILEEEDDAPGVPMALDTHDGIGKVVPTGHDGANLDEQRSSRRAAGARREIDARRTSAIESARSAGFLGALDGDRPFGDIPGTGSPARSLDDIRGSIYGTESGEIDGTFAVDRRLRGGCTGDDCGTIGTGRYATICGGATPGAGCADGHGAGYGFGRSHAAAVPTIYMCGNPNRPTHSPCVAVIGDLDKSIIRRYIRRKLGAIQYCYERGLLQNGSLSGTVDVDFVIDSTGHTRDIVATGVHSDVAACVATVIESIQFPLSKNSGFTKVRYPFELRVAGS